MANHKNVVLRIEVRPAGRACECKHNKKHTMSKGDLRFVVKESGPAAREYGYCRDCGVEMLDAAASKLDAIRSEIEDF
ncbi:MAG: hypothetical protein HYX29_11730 [Solirubrobacterales bacterium]|nr:hypothetical protein [Solirubrobacterales bacterium]